MGTEDRRLFARFKGTSFDCIGPEGERYIARQGDIIEVSQRQYDMCKDQMEFVEYKSEGLEANGTPDEVDTEFEEDEYEDEVLK